MTQGAERAQPVLLIHGLWMRGWVMRPLAARLRQAGFAPRCLDYPSLRAAPGQILQHSAKVLVEGQPGPVHLLGHSLGGLLALALCASQPALPIGRVLCLGSPLAGSHTARRLRELGLAWLGGRSRALLEQGVAVPDGREVGVIAGTRALGAGQWLARVPTPHDGTVSVAETRIAGLTDHLCLPHSHSGLLWARDVATACAQFLHNGRFG
jgi:pimeloyl-ACP methyl ester carboxylesterase